VSALRILLADDHGIVRQGLKLLIDNEPDMQVVGEAADGDGVLRAAASLHPDIIILDISMPGMSGLAVARALKNLPRAPTILALTRHDDRTYLEELLRAGASGYVLKQSAPGDLPRAIRAVAAGGVYIDPAMKPAFADGLLAKSAAGVSDDPVQAISEREAEVLRLIAVGHTNKEIAAALRISVKTVEVHKANAMRKLGLKGRVDVVRYGVLQGWLHDT
jgi:DNA-binding NarL/FixJ family response regulator